LGKGKSMDKNVALIVAGVVFSLVALLHLTRLVTKFEVAIAKKIIPLWLNVIGLIVAGLLAIWMFAAARC
jgi:uncharacterized membrane protein YqhA